ncbi:hypothetical protein XU18_0036 [Perkinsela sp. CCAP 1560/4]|nr:hypothetical protein XU18_0036 [Perkinsela sp. CCAP 1560/4]|eukprot:KNH09351.1 hypothetical protein XU18_0036 [Perkinsela sp. CCAP 1560/4]
MFDNIPENVGELLQQPSRKDNHFDKKKATLKKSRLNSHPLSSQWKVWYNYIDANTYSSEPTDVVITNEEPFRMSLLDLFDTVEGFWRVYTKLAVPSSLVGGSCLQVFSEEKAPVESDHQSSGGSKFSFIVKDESWLDPIWERLLLAIVGGELDFMLTRLTSNDSTCENQFFSGVVFGKKKFGGRFVLRTSLTTQNMRILRGVASAIRTLFHLSKRIRVEYQTHDFVNVFL